MNFRNNFHRSRFTSVTLKQGLYSLSCTCCKTSYLKISRVFWTLEAARLCLNILQLSTFRYDRRGLATLLLGSWATCQISKRLGNSKYQSHAFCYWLTINNTLRLLFHCHFWPHFIRTTQKLHGPPGDPLWMLRWPTQDLQLWATLILSHSFDSSLQI